MVYSAESMAQVELGRQGEHLARTVQIDVSCLQRAFPEAAFALVYRRPHETALYIAETELIGPLLTWTVPAQATQKAGTGRLEVRAMVGETVAKSVTAKTRVEESLTGAGETPPESAGDWVGKVLDAAERAEAAADRAEQAGGSSALPPMTPADAGSVLAVNAGGTGYTFLAIASDAETDEALQDAFSKPDDKMEEKKHGV